MASKKAREIIVAVDATEGSKEAFVWALENLIREGDAVTLLNVKPTSGFALPLKPADPFASESSCSSDDADGYYLAMEQLLHDLKKLAHDQYKVSAETAVRSGDPKQVLVDEVGAREAAALVMSSRCQGPIQRAFHGSVSDFCSRHADCAVIIVKGKQ